VSLLTVEIRRAVNRRVVRVLILIALIGCVAAGVIAFVDSSGKTLAELNAGEDLHPAVLTNWWVAQASDGAILIAAFFLLIGGVIGGATVAGSEWRAGTITTMLTWEPRRIRLNLARTTACGIAAFVIALALQALFLAAFVPAVLAHGTTAGADGAWWASLLLTLLRTALLTALAAMLAVALATLGRNTAFAFGALFGWVAVVEGVIRGLRPGWKQYLFGENVGTVMPWKQLDNVPFTRGPLLALCTLVAYTVVIVVGATIAFERRDVAGTS
jgi:ABC-type transport system involved in multi-copper enzyme maturation permease subunit